MAAAPVPLKYVEIARIQRHFLKQIRVQVGPLVVFYSGQQGVRLFSQLAEPSR